MRTIKANSKEKKWHHKKKVRILAVFVLILIISRILLPTVLKYYANKTLENIPGYYGQISNIEVGLFSGKYVIEGLYLNKINAKTQIPFLNFPRGVVAIDVKELFDGHIVSDIYLEKPEIIYILSDHNTPSDGKNEPELEDWSKALTDLVPIAINQLDIVNGKFGYVEVNTKPNIDLHIQNISLMASNLRNTRSVSDNLPSTIAVTGNTVGGGSLKLDGQMDLIKKLPDLDITFTIENSNAPSLNAFTKHYTGIDFARGTFQMFGELKISSGQVEGLVVPAFVNTKFIGKGDKFLSVLWEGFVGMFKFVLKNHKNNSISMKVPFKGDLTKVKTNKVIAFFSIFKNAWVKAFYPIPDKKKDTLQDSKSTAEKN